MANFVLDKGFLWQGAGVVSAFYFVQYGSVDWSAQAITVAGTQRPIGIVQENLDAVKAATGKAIVDVRMMGISRLVIGAAGCTRGQLLQPDATGAGVVGTAGTGKFTGAMALQTAVAGDQIDVLLNIGIAALL